MQPTVPISGDLTSGTAHPAARSENFTAKDRDDLLNAGTDLALTLADVVHHEVSAYGTWMLFGETADEINRLHNVLDELNAALWQARHTLRLIDRRTRRRATRHLRTSEDQEV